MVAERDEVLPRSSCDIVGSRMCNGCDTPRSVIAATISAFTTPATYLLELA